MFANLLEHLLFEVDCFLHGSALEIILFQVRSVEDVACYS